MSDEIPVKINNDGSISKLQVKQDGLDGLIGSMPDVVPEAVQAAKDKENDTNSTLQSFVDSAGTRFDAQLHSVDAEGNPKISTITGKLKLKPGARFGKKQESFINLPKEESKPDPQKEKIKAAAVQMADTFIMGGVMIVGDEWKDHPGERDGLILANEAVFERYGIVELHPVANMGIMYGLYICKRIMKPQSKSQIVFNHFRKQAGETIKNFSNWIKYNIFRQPRPVYKKPEEKGKPDAQSR